jgi:hypothetical protein
LDAQPPLQNTLLAWEKEIINNCFVLCFLTRKKSMSSQKNRRKKMGCLLVLIGFIVSDACILLELLAREHQNSQWM